MDKKAFTIAEVLVALFILVLFMGSMFMMNANFVSALSHGASNTFAKKQADAISEALKTLANESKNIWITPLIDGDTDVNDPWRQSWVATNDTGTLGDNVQVGLTEIGVSGLTEKNQLSQVDVTDIPIIDTFIYGIKPTHGSSSPTNYCFDPEQLKRGYWMWFNCLDGDGDEEVRGLLEVKLLGPSEASTSARVAGSGPYPSNSNNSDAIRVSLFVSPTDDPLTDHLSEIQSIIEYLDSLPPDDAFFNFRNARINNDFGGSLNVEGGVNLETESGVSNANNFLLASYVVDYNPSSVISYKQTVPGLIPSEYGLYHSVNVLPEEYNGGVVVKLPHPHDADAVEVPKTFGLITSTWGNHRPLATAQDLGIENAKTLTIYPTFAD